MPTFKTAAALVLAFGMGSHALAELPLQEVWTIEFDDTVKILKSIPRPGGEDYLFLVALQDNRVCLVDSAEVVWTSEEFDRPVTAVHGCDFTQEGNLTILVNCFREGEASVMHRFRGESFEDYQWYSLGAAGRSPVAAISEALPGGVDRSGRFFTLKKFYRSWSGGEGEEFYRGHEYNGSVQVFELSRRRFIRDMRNIGYVNGETTWDHDGDEDREWITLGGRARYEYYRGYHHRESRLLLTAFGTSGLERQQEILFDYSDVFRTTNLAVDATGANSSAFCIVYQRSSFLLEIDLDEFAALSTTGMGFEWMRRTLPIRLYTFVVRINDEPNRYFLFSSQSFDNIDVETVFLLHEEDLANPKASEQFSQQFDFFVGDLDADAQPELIFSEESRLTFCELDFDWESGPNDQALQPCDFGIERIYPNPFNAQCMIAYSLPATALTTIRIYDVNGSEVATLGSHWLDSGRHLALWDASTVPAGIYVAALSNGLSISTRRVAVLK